MAAAAARAALISSLSRLSSPHQAANLVPRRGLAAGGDHHGSAKINIWDDPMSPSKWKEEHFVLASLSGWGLLIYGGFKAFSGNKEEVEDENVTSPVLAPKQKDGPKDEPADNSPTKTTPAGSARGTPSTSKSKAKKTTPADNSPIKTTPAGSARGTPSASKSKAKKKSGSDDVKTTNTTPTKKESKPSVKNEPSSASKSAPSKGAASADSKTGLVPSAVPVTEEEIKSVLLATAPVNARDLVAIFKGRLKSQEDKKAFADVLRRVSKLQKRNGIIYLVLKDK